MGARFDRDSWLRATVSVPVAMCHASASGALQAVNPAWSALSALSVEQAAGAGWLEALHPADRDAVREAWTRATASGSRFEAEFRVCPSGKPLSWVRAIATPDPDQGGISGVWLDLTAQKQHEADLRTRQHMLETLLTNTTDTIFVKDRDGRYLLANDSALNVQNPGIGSPIGKCDTERFTQETARHLREIDLEVMRSGKPVVVEEVITLQDGTTRIHSSNKFPYRGEDGTIQGVMGISRDVTALKTLEAQLKQHEARLEEAQRLAHLGSWEWDLASGTVTWSDELYRIFGVDRATFVPSFSTYQARIHPDDRERIREIWTHDVAKHHAIAYAYRIIRPDGETRYLSSKAHVEVDASGKPVRAIGIALDMTDLHEAERELRRSHAVLQAEQEADLDGILVVDERGRVLTHNRRYQELWGIPDAIMATRDADALLRFICPLVMDPERDMLPHRHLRYDRTARVRTEIALKDGRFFERYTAPVISSQDEHFGRVWFLQDVTERKRWEESLREQNRKLQELDTLKSNFVNAISHDLRTPLTSIKGYAEFLEDEVGGSLNPAHHEFVRQIQQSASRLEHLVDDLLDFARMDAGTFKLSLKPTDLGALARGVIASLKPLADDAHVAIVDTLPAESLRGIFDAARIERVLMNLIGNALKFTGSGGRIEVRGCVDGAQVRCEIRDTGIGIAPEDVSKLFQRFSQLSPGMRQANGTGLGLSISKALVDAHGGTIGVESAPGKGSMFWFTLPRAADGEGSTDV